MQMGYCDRGHLYLSLLRPTMTLPPTAEQTYDNAVAALFSPLHQSQTPDEIRRAAQRRTQTPSDMHRYLSRLSLPHDDNTKSHWPKNIVHITGTKGKGSTAAICESILRSRDGLLTGMFTSPHLVDIRERIRIGGQPVSKEIFSDAYWEIRRRLEEWQKGANACNDSEADDDIPFLPGYFRMLALVAVFIFAHYVSPEGKRIDVIILEVGVGGRYDATNIFDHAGTNTVCGVTLIDYDHTRVLGNALSQIAWEKGGIFHANKENIVDVFAEDFDSSKHNITARPTSEDSETSTGSEDEEFPAQDENTRFYTISSNPKEVVNVLQSCAFKEGNGQPLGIVTAGDKVQPEWKIGLPGDHQRLNAELAVALCDALIKDFVQVNDSSSGATSSGQTILEDALRQTFWPGRCQTVPIQAAEGQNPITIRCDGAHTPQSLATCLDWFRAVSGYDEDAGDDGEEQNDVRSNSPRFLLFNCSHERNPIPLLQMIQGIENSQGRPLFDQIYFCRADSERPSALKKASAQELLAEAGILKAAPAKDGGEGEEESSSSSSWQDTLANVWMALAARKDSMGLLEVPCVTNVTVGDALDVIKHSLERNEAAAAATTSEDGDKASAEVCVTGSLYMVGSALSAAEWTETPCDGHLDFDSTAS